VSKASPSIRTSPEELQAWLEELVRQFRFAQLVAAVVALVTRLRDLNTELTKHLANLRRARPRSERMRALEAQLMLPWAMSAKPEQKDSSSENPPIPERKKKGSRSKPPGRKPLPPDLERVPAYNGVPAEMRRCPVCGLDMRQMGHTSCEYLDVIPAKVVVVHRIDEAVKCPVDGTIVAAPAPARIVEKGVLGDRLIIEATADKFLEHQPIERQSVRFARSGVDIAPQTLGRAVCAHLDLLKPLAQVIYDKTRAPGLLGTDSTGIPVLDPSSAGGIRTGAMWAWTNALWVSFFYSPSGDSNSVRRFLGEPEDENAEPTGRVAREVQADGTNILSFIERGGGTRPGCWAHARRGLALCARSGDHVALAGVKLMARLFAIERASKDAGENAEQRLARRIENSQVVVEAIRVWVDEQLAITPPKTSFGSALGYIKRQWRRLILFLGNGNIPLTNNRRERELRKLVLGRRNWLFVWKDIGGERTASILTILATCVSHGLNPRAYLHAVTQDLLRGDPVESLLPDQLGAARPDLRLPDFEAPVLPD
jgi:transposase